MVQYMCPKMSELITDYFIEHLNDRHGLVTSSIRLKIDKKGIQRYAINNLKDKTDKYHRTGEIIRVMLDTGINFLSLDNIDSYDDDENTEYVSMYVTKDTHEVLEVQSMNSEITVNKIASYYINIIFSMLRR